MVEKDVMVIVPLGNGRGIKMLKSEAERQGLRYILKTKAMPKAENKMIAPIENKAEEMPVVKNVIKRKPAKK